MSHQNYLVDPYFATIDLNLYSVRTALIIGIIFKENIVYLFLTLYCLRNYFNQKKLEEFFDDIITLIIIISSHKRYEYYTI